LALNGNMFYVSGTTLYIDLYILIFLSGRINYF